ncbi:MAG: hypothetical protein H0U52_07830 [Chloroflexi bacterium]|nr:hypothetical protein [Chloroflexota bacterium]
MRDTRTDAGVASGIYGSIVGRGVALKVGSTVHPGPSLRVAAKVPKGRMPE